MPIFLFDYPDSRLTSSKKITLTFVYQYFSIICTAKRLFMLIFQENAYNIRQ